jgi:hypothetical protein
MKKFFFAFCIMLIIGSCKTAPKANPDEVSLSTAIRQAAALMETRLDRGTKIALVNFTSPSQAFSEYVLDELSSVLVNNSHLTVVDRANLDRIRQELGFNLSGEVSDQSMQSIGQMLGAQALVTGSLTSIADLRRVMFKVLMTETAAVTVQHPADIINDRRVQALLSQGGGSQGLTYSGQGSTTPTPAPPPAAADGTTPTPTPAPSPATPTPAFRIGDVGPAGGLIFYDKGNNSDGWRYMEAAPRETERELVLGNPYPSGWVVTDPLIGSGLENTRAFLRVFAENRRSALNTAAWYCDQLSYNGFDDWFLPCQEELVMMYMNLHKQDGKGEFRSVSYWMSRNWGGNSVNFLSGEITSIPSDRPAPVRAARRF